MVCVLILRYVIQGGVCLATCPMLGTPQLHYINRLEIDVLSHTGSVTCSTRMGVCKKQDPCNPLVQVMKGGDAKAHGVCPLVMKLRVVP